MNTRKRDEIICNTEYARKFTFIRGNEITKMRKTTKWNKSCWIEIS